MTDDHHALRPGASIAGYNILRVLGAGGFGITYEAESPFTGKRVAIKEFFPRGIVSRESDARVVFASRDAEVVAWALKRFESSTLDQCGLRHPHIVDVIHYVKDNDTGYMIMEYVEGQTLEDWLRAREYLPTPEELEPVLAPVLSALEYLHARNMIHRDIAPDNIMIGSDGVPKIIDFGAIKLIGQETQLRSEARSFMVMKQHYSPPEQTEDGGELDHRADIYSIGAVLYRAFGGLPPASAEERVQRRAFGRPDPYAPLAENAPHVPAAFAGEIDRALSFKAEERHAAVAELREALHWPETASQPPPTFLIPRDEETEPASRRRVLPWLVPLVGMVAIVAGGAIWSGFLALPKSETEIVKAPEPPKLDDAKEIPPVGGVKPKQETKQETKQDAPAQEAVDGYMVVVASHKTEQETQAALARLKEQLPALFAEQDVEVVGVDLGDSGAFYRAMIGPLVKPDADALCDEFKRNNVACLVRMDN